MTKKEIMTQIYEEIDNIPPIPENVARLRNLIQDARASIAKISFYIKQDPGLTADMLRISNSAWYMPRTRIDTIERAVTTIGLRQLDSILLSIGAKKVLHSRYKTMEAIWEHSSQCAFYAQSLAKMKGVEIEVAYIVGLLHDIGKLILLTLTPELMQRITTLSEIKSISVAEIEKLAIGIDHAQIGEMITAKWRFPAKVAVAIGHHHLPKVSRPEWLPLTNIAYMANILCHVDSSSTELLQKIEPKVLTYFEITTDRQLEKLINSLWQFYKSTNENYKF